MLTRGRLTWETSGASWRGSRPTPTRSQCTRPLRGERPTRQRDLARKSCAPRAQFLTPSPRGAPSDRGRSSRAMPTSRTGSAKEVEGQLIKARDLGLLSATEADDLLRLADRVSRLCFGLARPPKPP